jgi:hypothetical protein
MYEELLPALPNPDAVLLVLDCVTLAELDCQECAVWVKLKLPKLPTKPPQTASSSLSLNSRIVCHSLLGLRIAAQSILGQQGAAAGNASSQA